MKGGTPFLFVVLLVCCRSSNSSPHSLGTTPIRDHSFSTSKENSTDHSCSSIPNRKIHTRSNNSSRSSSKRSRNSNSKQVQQKKLQEEHSSQKRARLKRSIPCCLSVSVAERADAISFASLFRLHFASFLSSSGFVLQLDLIHKYICSKH